VVKPSFHPGKGSAGRSPRSPDAPARTCSRSRRWPALPSTRIRVRVGPAPRARAVHAGLHQLLPRAKACARVLSPGATPFRRRVPAFSSRRFTHPPGTVPPGRCRRPARRSLATSAATSFSSASAEKGTRAAGSRSCASGSSRPAARPRRRGPPRSGDEAGGDVDEGGAGLLAEVGGVLRTLRVHADGELERGVEGDQPGRVDHAGELLFETAHLTAESPSSGLVTSPATDAFFPKETRRIPSPWRSRKGGREETTRLPEEPVAGSATARGRTRRRACPPRDTGREAS